MTTHVSPSTHLSRPSSVSRHGGRVSAAARPASARSTSRPVRWTPARIGVTTFFGAMCAVTLAVGLWWLPPLLSGWSRLTPFEQPIGWFVVLAVVLMTMATVCATLAAALWPQRVGRD